MERLINAVKERKRCDLHHIPYKKCPKLMAVPYLEANITWMNVFPKENGISNALSTSAIMLRTPNIDATHNTLQPVSYVYCNFKTRRTNNMKTRNMEETSLRRSKKSGGHYFMSLKIVRRLHGYQCQ